MADMTRWTEKHPSAFESGMTEWSAGEFVKYTDHLAALERMRVETLREARAEVEAEAIHPWPDPNWFDMGYIAGHQDQLRDALAAIDRLINAATTGDTDD